MKKKLAFASLMLVGTIASAMDVNYFVAAGAYRGYTTLKATHGTVSTTEDKNEGAFVIDGGVLLAKIHKIDLEYANFKDGSHSLYSIGLGYEYLIDLGSKFKPFIGASYDIVKYTRDSQNISGVVIDEVDLTTNALMGRIGTEYDFTQHFYASASYDYALTKSGNTEFGYTKDGIHHSNIANAETDKLSKFEFLVGYKF